MKEFEEEEAFEEAEDATGDVSEIQQQFDMQIAHLLFANAEADAGSTAGWVIAESERPTGDALRELEYARAEFIRQIGELEEGEDLTKLKFENSCPPFYPFSKSRAQNRRAKTCSEISG